MVNAVSVYLKTHKTDCFMNPKIYIRTTLQTVYTKVFCLCFMKYTNTSL